MDAPSTANVHGEDIEFILDIARLAYEEKDYKPAYEYLSTVLDIDPRNSEAHELRALTAKQLNDPSYDLQADAEFLVETEPHRALPYFSLIDWLLSHGRFHNAVLLARTATFRVYHTDPEFRKLKDLCAKLQATEHNFFVELPPEVLYEIFALLPFKSRLDCISVSKRWRNTLTRIPDLWNTIDFEETDLKESVILALKNFSAWSNVRNLNIPICDRTLGTLMQHNFRYIRKFDISNADTPLDQLVFVIAMREIGNSWQDVSFTLNVQVRLFFAAAAYFCPNLKKVTIGHYFPPYGQQEIERDILGELDASLELEGTVSIKTLLLNESELDSPTRKDIFRRCTALQELTLINCNDMLPSQDIFQSMLVLPTLQSLTVEVDPRIHYIDGFSDDSTDLCTFLAAKPPATLDLTNCPMCREPVEEISDTMRQGVLKRYKMEFRMDNEEHRALLLKKSMFDPTINDQWEEDAEDEAFSMSGDEEFLDQMRQLNTHGFFVTGADPDDYF